MEMIRQSRDDYRPTRRKNAVPLRLVVDGEEVAATLLDISRDGARLLLPFSILPGTAVELHFEAATVPALVQWFRGQNAGVRFLDRLEREVLIALEGNDGDDPFD